MTNKIIDEWKITNKTKVHSEDEKQKKNNNNNIIVASTTTKLFEVNVEYVWAEHLLRKRIFRHELDTVC